MFWHLAAKNTELTGNKNRRQCVFQYLFNEEFLNTIHHFSLERVSSNIFLNDVHSTLRHSDFSKQLTCETSLLELR